MDLLLVIASKSVSLHYNFEQIAAEREDCRKSVVSQLYCHADIKYPARGTLRRNEKRLL